MKEFDLIKVASKIFAKSREDIIVGVGEGDCAIVDTKNLEKLKLVLTTDSIKESTDFPPYIRPEEIGHLALAVNLSDLAASGAKPLYFLYTITLVEYDINFFEKLARGMKKLANKYDVEVVGGDIDSGNEICISGFAVGVTERVVTQSGAKDGDKVFITGLLGKAQLSLDQLMAGVERSKIAYPESLYTPEPKVNEGIEIVRYASSMTDISDSLAVSLNLISEKSGVRIEIEKDKLPLEHLLPYVDEKKALDLFIYSGGDYELVYTSKTGEYGIEIGKVKKGKGVWLVDGKMKKKIEFKGFTHFS